MSAVIETSVNVEDAVILAEHTSDTATNTTAAASVQPAADAQPMLDVFEIENTPLHIVKFEKPNFDTALSWLRTQVTQAPIDTTTKDGLARAKQLRTMCVKARGAADEAYDAWNRPYLAQRTENIATRDTFKDNVALIEKPIKAALDAQHEIDTAAKREKDRLEAERQAAHQNALYLLQSLPDGYVQSPSADIFAKLEELLAPDYIKQRNWEEFEPAAIDALVRSIEKLNAHMDNARQREQLAELQAQQRAQEEARRAEEEARAREDQRLADLRAGIDAIKGVTTMCVGMDSAFIQGQIDMLNADVQQGFAELQAEADQARATVLVALGELLNAAVQKEANDKEMAELRAQVNAQKAKDAEAQRLKDEEAARVEAEHVEAERQAEARRQAEEDARVAAERAAEEARQAEARAQEAARQEAERIRAAAEEARIARLQADAQRLLDMLREIVAYARQTGADWSSLGEADALIARIEGGQA
jgi:hypothetical protein